MNKEEIKQNIKHNQKQLSEVLKEESIKEKDEKYKIFISNEAQKNYYGLSRDIVIKFLNEFFNSDRLDNQHSLCFGLLGRLDLDKMLQDEHFINLFLCNVGGKMIKEMIKATNKNTPNARNIVKRFYSKLSKKELKNYVKQNFIINKEN